MGSARLTRRAALTGGVAVTAALAGLSACRSDDSRSAAPNPLISALSATTALLADFDATLISHPDLAGRLTSLREDHQQHVDQLVHELGSAAPSASAGSPHGNAPSSPVPDDPHEALQALVAAERRAQQSAAGACLHAPDRHASLLGSIAACRATHLAVLA